MNIRLGVASSLKRKLVDPDGLKRHGFHLFLRYGNKRYSFVYWTNEKKVPTVDKILDELFYLTTLKKHECDMTNLGVVGISWKSVAWNKKRLQELLGDNYKEIRKKYI